MNFNTIDRVARYNEIFIIIQLIYIKINYNRCIDDHYFFPVMIFVRFESFEDLLSITLVSNLLSNI